MLKKLLNRYTTIVFIVIFIISFNCLGQEIEQLDEKSGFRNIKLLSPLSSINNLEYQGENYEYMKIYRKSNENLKIGDTIVKGIKYGFYNDLLYSIEIECDYSALNEIKPMLEQLYGEPSDNGITQIWKGKRLTLEIHRISDSYITLEYQAKGWLEEFKRTEIKKAKKYKSEL